MEGKHRKRVKTRIKYRVRIPSKASNRKIRVKNKYFLLWASVLVISSALYFAVHSNLNTTSTQSAMEVAVRVRDAIPEIETLLIKIEKKIEGKQSLATDLDALIARKRIIEQSEFINNSTIRKFVKLLDPIEAFNGETDTDTKTLLLRVRRTRAYLEEMRQVRTGKDE